MRFKRLFVCVQRFLQDLSYLIRRNIENEDLSDDYWNPEQNLV